MSRRGISKEESEKMYTDKKTVREVKKINKKK